MSRPSAEVDLSMTAGLTVSSPPPGYPITAPWVPRAPSAPASAGEAMLGAYRIATSLRLSKRTTVALNRRLPDACDSVVAEVPETTWALVIRYPGPTG